MSDLEYGTARLARTDVAIALGALRAEWRRQQGFVKYKRYQDTERLLRITQIEAAIKKFDALLQALPSELHIQDDHTNG